MMVKQLGLDNEIDRMVHVLKQHQPYHESDHILNIAYNIIAGGTCIDDIGLLRCNTAYLDALGTTRIPDKTTAGDFLRRFTQADIKKLMEAVNHIRCRIWKAQSKAFRRSAQLYIDSTVAETCGTHKQGMNMAYTGEWGYHPLIISLGNTREPLYIENRPGNAYSSTNAIGWIDKSIDLVKEIFQEVWLGGDTAFYLTKGLDKWDEQGVQFVLGCKNYPGLEEKFEGVSGWKRLKRPALYSVKTTTRRKRHNHKERVIRKREFKQQTLAREYVTEMEYTPTNCKRRYRLVALKKVIKVTKGQLELFDQYRYFFYITNNRDLSTDEVVFRANDRCDHENDLQQLKSGVHALRMPGQDLNSNWAYTVIASLAWTLKSWMGLLLPHKTTGYNIIRMEFKRFLAAFINIPAQILTKGGQIIFRIANYMEQAPVFLSFVERCKCLKLPDG
jgi:hypothetical protein